MKTYFSSSFVLAAIVIVIYVNISAFVGTVSAAAASFPSARSNKQLALEPLPSVSLDSLQSVSASHEHDSKNPVHVNYNKQHALVAVAGSTDKQQSEKVNPLEGPFHRKWMRKQTFSKAQYDHEKSKALWMFADLAQCDGLRFAAEMKAKTLNEKDCPAVFKLNHSAHRSTIVSVIYNKRTHLQAVVSILNDQDIVISFRGTTLIVLPEEEQKCGKRPFGCVSDWIINKSNWIRDLQFKQITFRSIKGRVHYGFATGYGALREDLLKAVDQAIALIRNTQNYALKKTMIYITGHSLGGALAQMCAADFVASSYYPQLNLELWTYGSPRVGNIDFADFIHSRVKTVFRITYKNDVVPEVPPFLWDFWHVGLHVAYSGEAQFSVCSKGFFEFSCRGVADIGTSFGNHLEYNTMWKW